MPVGSCVLNNEIRCVLFQNKSLAIAAMAMQHCTSQIRKRLEWVSFGIK